MNSLELKNTLFSESITQHAHYLLVFGIMAVLVMMILPLPPVILDFLLAVNIVGALALLLTALSVNHPLKLSTFPSLLLMATLFRLGLNIASTRLILTTGDAGTIIHTFGYFVTKGNLLVGGLMFLILTIVQFVVIAKGAERVAEVAARFTLDAMPGKQMSIDADLRAGLITQEEAKKLRDELQKESKFYGAMDGAMKFVKGDAIAGLLIIFINILGGLGTGVFQQNRTFAEAGHIYTLLTIGDGLVNQIPALLSAITAGMIVTRVADTASQQSLGTEIGFQILSNPKALITTSGLALLMGLLPGFPFILFALIAMGISGLALHSLHSLKKKLAAPIPVRNYLITQQTQDLTSQAHPLLLEVGPELYTIFLEEPRWARCLNNLYPRLKAHLSNQCGVSFPDLRLSITPHLRGSFRYQIRIYEIPVDTGMLMPRHCSLPGHHTSTPDELKPEQTTETIHGTPLALWNLEKKTNLETAGLAVFGPEEMLLRHLGRVLKRHAADFMGIQEVRSILNTVDLNHPELVREVVPKMMSIQKLTEIVKRLVEEGIPIKDFRNILEILSSIQPETKDPVTLTEQVRVGMRRTITYMHVRREGQLPAYTLHPAIEDEVRQAIQKNGPECFLALPPERLRIIIEAFRKTFTLFPSSNHHVILTSLDIRRYVKKIIDQDFPDLPVLSFQELDPKVIIQPLGCVELGEGEWGEEVDSVRA